MAIATLAQYDNAFKQTIRIAASAFSASGRWYSGALSNSDPGGISAIGNTANGVVPVAGDTGFPSLSSNFGRGRATWSTTDKGANIVLTNGNLTATSSSGGSMVRANVSASTGKYYWEVRLDAGPGSSNPYLGVKVTNAALAGSGPFSTNNDWGLFAKSPNTGHQSYQPGSNINSVGPALAVGDVYMFAFDFTAGKFWCGRNGTWDASGNPGAGTNPTSTTVSGGPFSPWASLLPATTVTLGFLASSWTYSAPSGFGAWDDGVTPPTTIIGLAYLSKMKITNRIGAARVLLVDRLWHAGAYNSNVAVSSQPSFASRLPNGSYHGLQIWMEAVSGPGGGIGTPVITYTNSDGVAGRTTSTFTTIVGSNPTAAIFALQAGDNGVQKIDNVNYVSASFTINVAIVRPLCLLRLPVPQNFTAGVNPGNEAFLDLGMELLGMPQIFADSAISIFWQGDNGSTNPEFELMMEVASA